MKSKKQKIRYIEVKPRNETERIEFERRINNAFNILFEAMGKKKQKDKEISQEKE